MENKYKFPLVFFLLGFAVTIIGALFKIMHWPGARILLFVGMLSEVGAILILIINILKTKK